jgi:Family of unknown function (DUF6328)
MPVRRTTTDTDHSYDDRSWDQSPRHESVIDRLDGNWTEILQEIRVAQTGVQLLTAFLLTLPFQQRFARLDDLQLRVSLATVALSAGATIRLIAPVMVHRILFRGHPRLVLVAAAHRCAIAGLLLLGLALVGVIYVTFSIVGSPTGGVIAAGIVIVMIAGAWVLGPLAVRHRTPRR